MAETVWNDTNSIRWQLIFYLSWNLKTQLYQSYLDWGDLGPGWLKCRWWPGSACWLMPLCTVEWVCHPAGLNGMCVTVLFFLPMWDWYYLPIISLTQTNACASQGLVLLCKHKTLENLYFVRLNMINEKLVLLVPKFTTSISRAGTESHVLTIRCDLF